MCMQNFTLVVLLATLFLAASSLAGEYGNGREALSRHGDSSNSRSVQLGSRPFFLVNDMQDSALKSKLQDCADGPFRKTNFSIGHRGAALQFPEHTKESYQAAARMGAGIVECDVTFTKDKQLVCRHSQCDLHTTTNILATPLAAKCSAPFTPAEFDASGKLIRAASAQCCTSDITVEEFKSLRGKMDAFDPSAQTVAQYLSGTPSWRTDLYSGSTSGTLLTHREYIALLQKLGVKMIPELKSASVAMPYDSDGDGIGDYTQQDYARQLINEYKMANVKPREVWLQSFDIRDIRYWIANKPDFRARLWQTVYLDDAETVVDLPSQSELNSYHAEGIRIVAPPLFALLDVDSGGNIVASKYARNAKLAGLDIITWTLERSGILADGDNGFYYQTIDSAIKREGDVMKVLDVLAKDIGVLGIFSDWPATVSYYASCMNLQ